MFKRLFGAAFGFALLLAMSPPAAAQTAEAEALGTQVAHIMFQAMSFEAMIAKEMAGSTDAFDIKSRPEWAGMLQAAMNEEIRHDMPVMEQMLGHALAQHMSVEELKAGVIIIADPGIQKMIAAVSTDAKQPEPKLSREAERAAGSSAGRGFLSKFEKMETYLTPIQDDLVAEIIPGYFRRFADKVDAGEVARKAAKR